MKSFILFLLVLSSLAALPLRGQNAVLINEIMYHPNSTNVLEEYVELFNAGTNQVDLSGWRFTKGVQFTFPSNTFLAVSNYLVVAADRATFTNKYPGVPNFVAGWLGVLSDNGDEIQLEDALGQTVDDVSYAPEGDWAIRQIGVEGVPGAVDSFGKQGWEWFAEHDGKGKSLELINRTLSNHSGQNWASSTTVNGTPGRVNSVIRTNIAPMILEVGHLPIIPQSSDLVTITTRIADERTNGLTVTLLWRLDGAASFTSSSMFDDGLHGDGLANDGIYGIILPQQADGTIVEFYLTARDLENNLRTYPNVVPSGGSRTANLLYQVDNTPYNGNQPLFRLIMSSAEYSYLSSQVWGSSPDSDASVNGTFINVDGVVDGGTTTQLRYNASLRNRGHGSRTAVPHNFRVDFAKDNLWKKRAGINFNTQNTECQQLGSALFRRLGMPMAESRPVQVRVNASNLASSGGLQFGSYAGNEFADGTLVKRQFPLDDQGNFYRGIRDVIPGEKADLSYKGSSYTSYTNAYFKENNKAQNDWADLIQLTYALSANTPDLSYTTTVRGVADVEEWMKFFAVNTLLNNTETTLATGYGDDYALYRGTNDSRFLLLPYDMDSIMGSGASTTTPADGIFKMKSPIPALTRFMEWPDFAPIYYRQLKGLAETAFAPEQMNLFLDQLRNNFDSGSAIDTATANMKLFNQSQVAYVLSQIPMTLTASSSLPVTSGYPRTTSPTTALNGLANVIDTRTVLVNGSTSSWVAWQGTWMNNNVTLRPGINRVLVQSLGTNGVEFARTNIDIWYDDSSIVNASGTLAANTIWTAAGGPYNVSANLIVPAGVTLTIQPGTTVYVASGVTITVNGTGKILAQGSETNRIRIGRNPSIAGNWGSLDFINTTVESRLAYVDFDSCGGTTTSDGHDAQVHVNSAIVFIDHCTWPSTPVTEFISFNGSSFIVQNCTFPSYPPPTGPESLHGINGIPAGGYGIFRDNYFGHTWGFNDTIDFTGGNRPGAILQFINNVFDGASDDCLDLDSTDAWIEGNIFMHVHRDPTRTDQAIDTGSAISGGVDVVGQNSDWTIINNLFYDVDHVFLNKGNSTTTGNGGGRVAFLYNTVAHVARESSGSTAAEIAAFDWSDDNIALPAPAIGSGLYAAHNIIYDCPALQRFYNPTNLTVIFENNLLPVEFKGTTNEWTGAGSGNQYVDPRLSLSVLSGTPVANVTAAQLRQAFQLRPGSPAVGAGFGGRDLGGLNPFGIALAGEPEGTTASTSATLTVGPGGVFNWGATTPQPWGWTAFKWKLDSGAFSAEIAVTNPSPFTSLPTITLSNLSSGPHTVFVTGKNDAGYYQDDPFVYPPTSGVPAHLTASKTWIVNTNFSRVRLNEVLAKNSITLSNGLATPDLIELRNEGRTTIDLSGMGLTDKATNHYKFTFPAGTTLAGGSYLVVYGDSGTGGAYLHTGFSLKDTGDDLYLYDRTNNGGALLDSVSFGLQLPDFSIGRLSGGSWGLCRPTFGTNNVAAPYGNPFNLKINEWLADAQFIATHDFVELYNPDPLPTPLGGLFLSDAPGALELSPIPPLSFIAANGFTSFIADGDLNQGADHVNFKLSPDGGVIILSAADLSTIDVISYASQRTDLAQGRSPNGGPLIVSFPHPTPGGGNPGAQGGSSCTVSNTTLALMPLTQSWKYNQSNNLDGINWMGTNYDDTTWQGPGPALLAFEINAVIVPLINTTLLDPKNVKSPPETAYYFRTTFKLTTDLTGFTVTANARIDDGAVIYVNGVEIPTRIRMAAGTVTFTTFANGSPSGTGDATANDTFTIPSSYFVQGTNYIAASVHQINSTSSDIVWGMQLDAIKSITNCIVTSVMPVLLNEVLASNATLTNSDGTTPDWVELYNPSTNVVDLSDTSLSDDPSTPRKFVFSAGVTIAPGGYRVVFCDGNKLLSSTNTGFNLDAKGSTIYFFHTIAGGGGLLDAVTFGLQTPDYSIGRIPNGTGLWVLNQPTRGINNTAVGLGSVSGLRVNEWMADPASGSDWFEIYNTNTQPVAIGGLFLTDDLNNRFQSPIAPLSFIGGGVLNSVGGGSSGFIQFFADNGDGNEHVNFSLKRTGEALGIFTAAGVKLDGISFGAQTTGVSQGRFPDGSATIISFVTTPSPAESNYLPLTNAVVNEVLTHTDPPLEDAIEFYNPSATATNIGGFYLSNTKANFKKYRIANNTSIPANGYVVFYENQFGNTNSATAFTLNAAHGDEVILSAADALGNLTGYRSRVKFDAAENGVSLGRYRTSLGVDFVAMSQRTFGADAPTNVTQFRTGTGLLNASPKVGPVVLNEIMFHPVTISGTNISENPDEEFLELRNITASPVPLYDPAYRTNTWSLNGAVDFVFPTNITLAANGFLLLVDFNPTSNPAALAAFRSKYGVSNTVPIFGPWSGRLDNNGDSVELYKPDSVQLAPHPDVGFVPAILVDRVQYKPVSPWPTNADGNGFSLQRLNSSAYGNDPVNWFVSAPTAGRTNVLGFVDSDGDTMDDNWEMAYFGTLARNGAGDFDNDGMTDLDEYRAGTNPTDPASNLKIISEIHNGTNFVLSFNVVAGKGYSVLYRTNFSAGSWLKFTNLPTQSFSGSVNVTDSSVLGVTNRYYQIVTPPVP